MKCSGGKCEVSCLPDYAFPKGEDILFIVCMDGRWITKNFEYNEIPPCKGNCYFVKNFPHSLKYINSSSFFILFIIFFFCAYIKAICNPGCLNKGICVAPGQCQCPENFMGPTCQFKKQVNMNEISFLKIFYFKFFYQLLVVSLISTSSSKFKKKLF
jgi:von Willebrand factor